MCALPHSKVIFALFTAVPAVIYTLFPSSCNFPFQYVNEEMKLSKQDLPCTVIEGYATMGGGSGTIQEPQ